MTRGFRIAFKAAIILIAIVAAVLIASVILWLIGAEVGATFYTICIAPLTNMLHISEVLIRAIPLCIIAIGISVAYRSGIINIGAEGQMAMGILGFTTVALALPNLPKPVLLPFALLAGVVTPFAFWFEDDPFGGCIRFPTERETERMMGLPEGWTEYGADGKPISSTQRYRALGNSIALPCADYLMAGIAEALDKDKIASHRETQNGR